jgi:hypothetical protein
MRRNWDCRQTPRAQSPEQQQQVLGFYGKGQPFILRVIGRNGMILCKTLLGRAQSSNKQQQQQGTVHEWYNFG